jgi:S-adenosyl methyltransferase
LPPPPARLRAAQTLDFGRPVAIMLIAILHLILDRDDPYDLLSQLVNAVVPGSYVVISHAASDIGTGAMISMTNRLNELMAQQSVPRTHREVAAASPELMPHRQGARCDLTGNTSTPDRSPVRADCQ